MFDHHHRHPPLFVEIDDVTGHVLFLFLVHSGHRLIEQDQIRFECNSTGQFDPFAQAIREGSSLGFANMSDLKKVDNFLDLATVFKLFSACSGKPVQAPGQKIIFQQVMTANHDVIKYRHVTEQSQILEGAADTEMAALIWFQVGNLATTKMDPTDLRVVAPGNAVEH